MAGRKTNICVGPVTVPVIIEGAEVTAPRSNNYCNDAHDPVRIVAPQRCPQCGSEDRTSFKPGVEVNGVVEFVTEKEKFDHSSATVTKHLKTQVEHLGMVSGKTYWVLPNSKGNPLATPLYASLRQLVADPEHSYVIQWGWTTLKTNMWLLRVHGGNLVMQQMLWPDEVKIQDVVEGSPDAPLTAFLSSALEVRPFDAADYPNVNRREVEEARARALSSAPATKAPTTVEDLMSMLKAQMAEQTKKGA